MTLSKSQERKTLLCPEGFRRIPIRGGAAYARQDVEPVQIEKLLAHEGEVLKASAKTRVRRLGHWVVKETRPGMPSAFIGRARRRCRHHWMALHFLRNHNVHVPEPLAYVEYGRLGLVSRGAHIFQYLSFFHDVENYLSLRIREGIEGEDLESFLKNLAQAVNALCASGAWHADLSGKNIMTRDGVQFYFVDLDAVELDVAYDDAKRLKNHVQLYDSFCDALSDALLVPFIQAMLPEDLDLRVWMPKVRQAQQKRRAKVEAHWAKYGQPEHINPLRAFQAEHPTEMER